MKIFIYAMIVLIVLIIVKMKKGSKPQDPTAHLTEAITIIKQLAQEVDDYARYNPPPATPTPPRGVVYDENNPPEPQKLDIAVPTSENWDYRVYWSPERGEYGGDYTIHAMDFLTGKIVISYSRAPKKNNRWEWFYMAMDLDKQTQRPTPEAIAYCKLFKSLVGDCKSIE